MRRNAAATGAMLAFAIASRAHASSEEEGARAAAPIACVVEQFALRSYVTALRSGDATAAARDPARLPQAITPLCRQAIDNERWPGLATELLARVSDDPALKKVICQIAPPQALPTIVAWERAGDGARGDYDVACALALLRYKPADFERIVSPRLAPGGGRTVPPLAIHLSSAMRPEERLALLPVLDVATQSRARGRDRLYGLLCEHPAAQTQAVCQGPATLEEQWAHDAKVERGAWRLGLLASLLALMAGLLWKFRRRRRPR